MSVRRLQIAVGARLMGPLAETGAVWVLIGLEKGDKGN